MTPDLAALLQDVLGPDYRVERELEGGGMSRVFLATDVRHERLVVVKVLPPELVSDQSAQRFKREIEITVRLQHPHILPVLTSGTWKDGSYYITPFIAGESLRARIEREKKLPLDDIVKILGDIGSAVAFAHARGIIHRDIKPGNILFADGESILADFGIARIVSTEATPITTTGVMLGTPSYMAPEMATHEAADVYSLGVVACEMLTGALPSRGMGAREIVAARGTMPGDSRWRVAALAALISKAISPSIATRTATAQELLDQLEAARHRWTRRHFGIGVGVAMTAGLAVFAYSAARKGHAELADAKYVVAAVGKPDSVTSDAVRSVTERLGDWRDVSVVDQALDPSSAQAPESTSVKDALARTRRLGARNLIVVEAVIRAGTVLLGATLYDADADSSLRTRRESYASNAAATSRVMPYRRLINSLLREDDPVPWRSPADREQASLAAWKAYDAGRRWLRGWRLDSAEHAFRSSIAFDDAIGLPHLWLAQAMEWQDTSRAAEQHAEAHLALTTRKPVVGRDSAYALGLQMLSGADFVGACALYRSILQRDSVDYVAQLGLGDCLVRDREVVRNARTMTGWAFRSGYESAGRSYRQAAENGGAREASRFRGWLLGRLSSVYKTSTNFIRFGVALTPDTVVMGARVYLNGDTVAYAPHPLADFATLRGDPAVRLSEAAVDRNRLLLLSFAQDWARRNPTDPAAYDSLAMWSEITGGSAMVGGHRLYTLDLLTYARSISRDSTEQLPLALAEVRNLVKIDHMERASAEADSLLRAGVAKATRGSPRRRGDCGAPRPCRRGLSLAGIGIQRCLASQRANMDSACDSDGGSHATSGVRFARSHTRHGGGARATDVRADQQFRSRQRAIGRR